MRASPSHRRARPRLGRRFGWLWAAYGVSTVGTWLAFDAFPLVAILVLHAGPAQVSALAATGLIVGAAIAIPLGPWVEFRRKRPVMVAMDLVRFGALLTVPLAYALGALSFGQLLVVAMLVGAADITFKAASGAHLKALVEPDDLLVANGRFESTQWTASVIGPPLGGMAIGLLGPVTTVIADAVSFVLSALGIRAIGGAEPAPATGGRGRLRPADLLDGWRYILVHAGLRRLLLSAVCVNGLIMATSPLIAVLMLGRLGFAPWQYGLAFGAACAGGLIGSRLAWRLVDRFGERTVMLCSGALRAVWPLGLVFIGRGAGGLLLVIAVEFGLVTSCGVFNPVMATYRLRQTETPQVSRVLSAWSVSTSTSIALMTLLWGALGGLLGPRAAIGIAGGLMLLTPLLLPWRATRTRSGADAVAPAAISEPGLRQAA